MKKIFKYSLLLVAAVIALASCKKEVEDVYTPAEPQGSCYDVYFPVQDASGDHTYDPEMERTATITVSRSQEKPYINEAIKVPYVLTESESGIFQIGDIEFASGQSETTVEVKFDKAEIGKKYAFTLQITDPEYAAVYTSNKTSFDFSVLIVTWEYFLNPKGEKALVEFKQGYWGETAWAYIKYYEVNGIRTCVTETQPIHFYNEEYEGYGFYGTGENPGEGYEWTFTWYVNEKNNVGGQFIELPFQPAFVGSDGEIRYVSDALWYYIYDGQITADAWLRNAKNLGNPDGSYPCSYYDGNGGFYIYVFGHYMADKRGSWQQDYDVIGVAEGFVRTDYSLSLTSDYPYDGVSPIAVEAGMDVDKIKYAVYEGELTAGQAKNKEPLITDGTDASESFSDFEEDEEEAIKYATLEISPEKTGLYTIVAVAYDSEGTAQEVAYTTFNAVTAEDQEEYLVEVSAFTEDTPERYDDLHNYDSFAYGIKGKELTEVHLAIIPEATLSQLGSDQVIDMIKNNAESYAVSEDVLEQINANGGYYTVATKLAAKTTYYVIVWATNGAMEDVAYATYTTEKLPYVWNSLGKGTITDGFCVYLFGKEDITATCDVYQEQNNPGLYMITGYQLSIVSQFFGMTEDDLRPYEGGNWNNTEVIIDASDPDAVFIEEQDYGVCVNGQYGFFQIETEKSGTLKDGVITWPAEEMYIGLPGLGKWFISNDNGTFNITLPAATNGVAPAKVPATAGEVKDFVLTTSQKGFPFQTVVYEREAQPVKVSVKVSYTRKENSSEKKAEEVKPAPRASF